MSKPDPKTLAEKYLSLTASSGVVKTAGEVRFVKDKSDNKAEWAWGMPSPSQREMSFEFKFANNELKPLVATLRSTLAALGHISSANTSFVKIKSAKVSPDGSLGGKGYIMKIADMRRQFMNCVEVLSALSDTLYDEVNAPHWKPASASGEVEEILDDVGEIREDPEAWAEEAVEDETRTQPRKMKTASLEEIYFNGESSE